MVAIGICISRFDSPCSNPPLVVEPYTQREVRLHICRLRDLLNGPQLKGMFNGTNTEASLSFLRCVMGENPEGSYSLTCDM